MNIINKIVHIINGQSPSIGDPKNVFTNVAVWFVACLAFAATSILSATAVYADYTISMTTSGAHSVDVKTGAGGETGTSISEDAITVTTTCPNGYNLTLSTSVNDNNLYLGGDSSNNTAGTYFAPADGTTALSNAANTWGYYYESSNSNNTAPTKTSIFNPVPVKGSATTIKASTSTSDSFSIYYGVAVSSSMTPGTYKMIPDTNNAGHDGAIVYQLTMSQSCLPYTVVFNPTSTAGGTNLSGTGTMNDQIIPAGVATALNSNTFTAPTGYEFDSWNTAQDGTGTSYTDSQSVTGLTTGGTSITLYAQWKLASIIYMQDMSFNECTTTPMTVYDKRDNQAYTVAKLADGKCWMTTNLNLAGGTKLDSYGSDVPAGYTQSNPYYTLPASSTSGFSSDTAAYVYNSGNTTSTCTSPGCYSYYSWLAATAGGKDSSGSSVTSDGYNVAYSICPKGWRLPTATTSNANAQNNNNWKTGDFYALATAYGADLESNYSRSFSTFYNNAGPGTTPNFMLAGFYYSSSLYNGGSDGYYWSSTSNSSSNAYYLSFHSSYVTSANDRSRRIGHSVRCLKKKPTMQSVTSSDLATLMPNEGDTTILPDARDDNEYTIKKINGQYWMTQNLRFTGTSVLSATSNVTSDKTLTYYSLASADSSYSGHCDSTNGYNNACIKDSGYTSTGVWYNYYAATAGTVSGSSNSTATSQDICPKNWHLPTGPNTTSGTDFNKLVGNTTSGWQATTTGLTAFGAVAGGYYNSGSLYSTGLGRWWSATASSTASRYYLLYDSSNGQFSGNDSSSRYSGNFVRCVKEKPTMQSVTSSDLAEFMPNEGDTTTLKDARDGQEYTIAKLADGKYWMTTDLNLAGGTTLNASDSDVPSDNYYTLPASSTSGFSSETTAYVYNSGNTTNCGASGQSTECYSYYSWLAATAGGKNSSGSSVTSNGYNATYSVCPKGWRLPTATTSNASATSSNNWKTGDFYALATAYGANLESSYSQNSGTFYNNAGPGTTPNFLLAGYYISSSFNAGGTGGNYWSSTSNSSNNAYNLNFRTNRVISASNSSRKNGFTVRCLFDN